MNTRVGVMILAVLTMILGSCANYSCPTYSTSRGHGAATASVKKGKPAKKGATPYYKTLKMAEQD